MPRTPENWTRVEVIAAPGTEFGVVSNSDGTLILVARRAGEEWPAGAEPIPGSTNVIAPGRSAFVVERD